MTGLLTLISVIALIVLLVSASGTIAGATKVDPNTRGRWGLATWKSTYRRPLDPHERRWQTALLAGKDNGSRWRDLVTEVETLEYLSNVTDTDKTPQSFDNRWVEERITNLETIIEERARAGEMNDRTDR